ncbi:hypothetical protein [Bacillus cereus]|uniref:hypothetical protein n=1 Tax=Bacillus cereus TaxID=1396 RepID=UPI000B4B369B|nr:hypothetical protein [Bacillus cereus]
MNNSRSHNSQDHNKDTMQNNIIDFPISNNNKEDTFILGGTPITGILTSDNYKVFESLDTEYFINQAKKLLYGNNPPEGIPTSDDYKAFDSLDVEYFVNQTKNQLLGTGKNENIQFNPNRERICKEIAEDLKNSLPKKSLSSFFGFKK